MNQNTPDVIIVYMERLQDDLKDLLAGIEEEGVPFKTYHKNFQNIKKQCVEAVNMSALEIGVVMTSNGVFVLSRDMIDKDYLFKVINYNEKSLRILGNNIGRFAKGISLKM